MEQSDIDLGILSKEILSALENHGGEATSSEIREFLGVDNRSKINYRLREELEPRGLIDSHQPESGPGPIPPKELTLTDDGKRVLEEIEAEHQINRDIAERVEQLERQIEDQPQHPSSVSQSDFEALQSRVNRLEKSMQRIKTDPLFDEDFRKNLDDMRVGVIAVTDFVIDEHDAMDDLSELTAEYAEDLNLLRDETVNITADSVEPDELDQHQIGKLAMEIERVKDDPLFDDDIRLELDAVRTGALAMRDYLFEEHDAQDEIEKRADEYEDQIRLLTEED